MGVWGGGGVGGGGAWRRRKDIYGIVRMCVPNRATFRTIKYMNGSAFFFKGQIYEWGRFRNTGSHIRTTITLKLPPLPHPPPPPPTVRHHQVVTSEHLSPIKWLNCAWLWMRILQVSVGLGGGGGGEAGGRGNFWVIVVRVCVQVFRTYPIHILGLWKNRPIYLIVRNVGLFIYWP